VSEMAKPSVCMVTGGSGLYGSAIKAYVESAAAEKDATWVFLSSKDGDLRDRKATEAKRRVRTPVEGCAPSRPRFVGSPRRAPRHTSLDSRRGGNTSLLDARRGSDTPARAPTHRSSARAEAATRRPSSSA